MIQYEEIYGVSIKKPQLSSEEEIINYGLPKKEQKWVRHELPAFFEKVQYTKEGDLILTKEQREYASAEAEKCKKGVWIYINGTPTYLPKKYYFYLQWWVLEDGTRPEYRDCDRRYFVYLEYWEKVLWCLGIVRGKKRREGASSQATSNLIYECIFFENSNTGLISKSKDDSRDTFTDMVGYGYRQLPPFLKPRQLNKEISVTEYIFAQKSSNTKEGITSTQNDDVKKRSKVNYRAPVLNAYDRGRMSRILLDEFGKLEKEVKANILFGIISKTLVKGVKRVGFVEMPSTVNKLTKGGEGFKIIWNNADLKIKTPTVNRLVRYFCPAHDGYEGFIGEFGESVINEPTLEQYKYLVEKWVRKDEDGNVISELTEEDIKLGAKAYILKRRIGLQGDDLEEEIRMNPENEREMFMSANADCIFNLINLDNQIQYLKDNPIYKRKIIFYRDLETSKVKWRDAQKSEENFCWEWIGDLNLKGQDNKYSMDFGLRMPARQDIGVIGVDGISSEQGGKKYGSKACAWIYTKYDIKDPENTGLFIGRLYGRPNEKATLHEQVMLCAEYNGFPIYWEFVSDDYYTYFKERGRLGYLALFPLNAIAPEKRNKQNLERHRGYPISPFAISKGHDAMITYVLHHSNKIYWSELCEDLKVYDPDKRTPSDQSVSAMITLVGSLEPVRNPPPRTIPLISVYQNERATAN